MIKNAMALLTPMEMNVKNGAMPSWKVVQSMLIGIGGNLICFLFLLTFLHVFEAFKFIPWIIAFNSMLTGYAVIDKTRNLVEPNKAVSTAAGTLTALMTCLVLTILSIFVVGENLVTIQDWMLCVVIGSVCSVLGALLAIKYHNL
ncbi:MAG: hypothetical protein PVI06_09050 [Desulfobacterales bacterium]|jgi:hypothetical protein